jgi:N utilization substance protein B
LSALREAESRASALSALHVLRDRKLPVKKLKDPRHLLRQRTLRALYQCRFASRRKITDPTAKSVMAHRRAIDTRIAKVAPAWPLKKINRIDLATLRLAVWELLIEKRNPEKVIIDEAVELAKEYGAEGSPGFVNGVLGSIVRSVTT